MRLNVYSYRSSYRYLIEFIKKILKYFGESWDAYHMFKQKKEITNCRLIVTHIEDRTREDEKCTVICEMFVFHYRWYIIAKSFRPEGIKENYLVKNFITNVPHGALTRHNHEVTTIHISTAFHILCSCMHRSIACKSLSFKSSTNI